MGCTQPTSVATTRYQYWCVGVCGGRGGELGSSNEHVWTGLQWWPPIGRSVGGGGRFSLVCRKCSQFHAFFLKFWQNCMFVSSWRVSDHSCGESLPCHLSHDACYVPTPGQTDASENITFLQLRLRALTINALENNQRFIYTSLRLTSLATADHRFSNDIF